MSYGVCTGGVEGVECVGGGAAGRAGGGEEGRRWGSGAGEGAGGAVGQGGVGVGEWRVVGGCKRVSFTNLLLWRPCRLHLVITLC